MIYAFHAENDALVRAGNDFDKAYGRRWIFDESLLGLWGRKLGPYGVTEQIICKLIGVYVANLN